jgi:hypothetical protein
MGCFQFESRDLSRQTLLRHFPTGDAWHALRIATKAMARLVTAIAEAYEDCTKALCAMIAELDPRTTTDMISEWEEAVSLPDPCLPQATTLDERRFWVQWRLNKRRYSTADDWRYLASLFGLEIAITPGWYVQKPALYPSTYPKRYDRFPKLGRFRVYINVMDLPNCGYDYGRDFRGGGYPIEYGCTRASYDNLKCLIERVKPANVVIIWDFPLENLIYGICTSQSFAADFSPDFCADEG